MGRESGSVPIRTGTEPHGCLSAISPHAPVGEMEKMSWGERPRGSSC